MTTMCKRVLPLGMAVFLLLTALFPVWAIAEEGATPAEVPMESVSPYRIILTAPGGWTSGNGAVMKVSSRTRTSWAGRKSSTGRTTATGWTVKTCLQMAVPS